MSKKKDKSRGNQNYYYFRFHEDFFEDLNIQYLETLPNGYEFLIILLKLYCFATKESGTFKFPTDEYGKLDFDFLAHILKFNRSIVTEAWHHITRLGFIETLISVDSVTVNVPGLEGLIGRSTSEADKRRLQRGREKNALPEVGNENVERVMEFGLFKNVTMTADEYDDLCGKYKNAPDLIKKLSVMKKTNSSLTFASDYDAVIEMGKANEDVKTSCRNSGVPDGIFHNVSLSEDEWSKLCRKFVDAQGLVDYISKRIYEEDYNMQSDYLFALKCGKEHNWQTVADKVAAEQKAINRKQVEEEMYKRLEAEKNDEMQAFYEKKAKELGVSVDEAYEIIQKNLMKNVESGFGSIFKTI